MSTDDEIWSCLDHQLAQAKIDYAEKQLRGEIAKRVKEHPDVKKFRNVLEIKNIEAFVGRLQFLEERLHARLHAYEEAWEEMGNSAEPRLRSVIYAKDLAPLIASERQQIFGDFLRVYVLVPAPEREAQFRSVEHPQLAKYKVDVAGRLARMSKEWREVCVDALKKTSDGEFRQGSQEPNGLTIVGRNGVLRREQSAPHQDPIEGFRSFTYNERTYTLTKGEGKRVMTLWQRLKKGSPKVLKSSLQEEASDFKLSKVFSTDDGQRFASDFIRNEAGKYWLDIP